MYRYKKEAKILLSQYISTVHTSKSQQLGQDNLQRRQGEEKVSVAVTTSLGKLPPRASRHSFFLSCPLSLCQAPRNDFEFG
jgi:hypothetical protein